MNRTHHIRKLSHTYLNILTNVCKDARANSISGRVLERWNNLEWKIVSRHDLTPSEWGKLMMRMRKCYPHDYEYFVRDMKRQMSPTDIFKKLGT